MIDLTTITNAKPETFPPYGHLSSFFLGAILSGPPTDWQGVAFDTFLDRMAQLYADVLWPNWHMGWQNAPALAQMGAITAADFEILLSYQQPGQMVIDQDAKSPNGPPTNPKTHLDLFQEEDAKLKDYEPFGHFLNEAYNAQASKGTIREIGDYFGWGLSSKVRGAVLELKKRSQRPRPYQMALIFGLPSIRNEQANTANSPALFCGHCLQGLLGGSAALTLVTPGSPAELALLQNMVDMGDRRVFAGVHYPSDNIASWILALTMIAGVYAGPWIPLMRSKIWQAIQMGEVYKSVSGGGLNNAYGPALQKLTDAASGQLDWMVA